MSHETAAGTAIGDYVAQPHTRTPRTGRTPGERRAAPRAGEKEKEQQFSSSALVVDARSSDTTPPL